MLPKMRLSTRSKRGAETTLVSLLFACCIVLPSRAATDPQIMADACATSDPAILQLFDATAFLMNRGAQQLVQNPDQSYAITPIGTYTSSPYGPLDPSSAYYGAQQAPAGRTGVLISSNTVLTSAHASPFAYTGFAYVFGLRASMVAGSCQYPDLQHIPSENVYFASTASDGQYNGVILNTYAGVFGGSDYVVITLDRPVVGRQPLAVRKSGIATPQDRFAGVYFSERLIPAKGDFAVEHFNENSPAGIELANLSLMSGASGGPIFNLDAGAVETVAASGNSCVDFYLQASGYFLLEQNCPGTFLPINGPISALTNLSGFSDGDLIFRSAFDQ